MKSNIYLCERLSHHEQDDTLIFKITKVPKNNIRSTLINIRLGNYRKHKHELRNFLLLKKKNLINIKIVMISINIYRK